MSIARDILNKTMKVVPTAPYKDYVESCEFKQVKPLAESTFNKAQKEAIMNQDTNVVDTEEQDTKVIVDEFTVGTSAVADAFTEETKEGDSNKVLAQLTSSKKLSPTVFLNNLYIPLAEWVIGQESKVQHYPVETVNHNTRGNNYSPTIFVTEDNLPLVKELSSPNSTYGLAMQITYRLPASDTNPDGSKRLDLSNKDTTELSNGTFTIYAVKEGEEPVYLGKIPVYYKDGGHVAICNIIANDAYNTEVQGGVFDHEYLYPLKYGTIKGSNPTMQSLLD
jgi:hypothetical protein